MAAQNAGILVYRRETSVVLEMFELSAQNHAVMGTRGRLCRKFPGVAIKIPAAKLGPALIRTVARTLGRMSGQLAPGAVPTTLKGGRSHEEIRDTAHPKMVTELLAAFLLPLGEAEAVTSIRKHTRDEVLWKDCKIPWRRSPLWLLMKVSIQLIFLRSGLEAPDALDLYKHFIVSFAAHILLKTTARLKEDPACTEWCDLIYAMRAKISRRVLKLGKPLPQSIQHVMADDILQRTWDHIHRSEAQASKVNIESLQSLDFEKDTHTKLPELDRFIASISERKGEMVRKQFTPPCRLPEIDRIANCDERGDTGSPGLMGAWSDAWASNLDAWLDGSLQERPLDATTSCTTLWRDMVAYENMVKKDFSGNPEAVSLMVLGVMELWVACDRLACEACPLLRDYDPDIDIRRLQSLLLPFRPQMKRLAAVEEYIENRKKAGTHKDIWTSFGQRDTFAVRYFDRSAEHKALRRRIEKRAETERESKKSEFYGLKHEYAALIDEVNKTECTCLSESQERRFHRGDFCVRCWKQDKARNMKIRIHEWPLPAPESDLKTVVFELKVPPWFSVWRDATNFVRFKLLECQYEVMDTPSEGQRFQLQSDMHLSTYFDRDFPDGKEPGFGLLSKRKPHAKTHYSVKDISGLDSMEEVLFANASRFQYFDIANNCMAAGLSPTEGIAVLTKSMTYRLPPGSHAIEQFIHRPPTSADGPMPNAVLSSQSECPDHLSLTEYKALCAMPLGLRIQWQNILLEVAAPSVDFKKEVTARVVLQCMYQAGPKSGSRWSRDGHLIPAKREDFGAEMLRRLRKATASIEKNWSCVNELACYIAIARRLLSLSPSDALTRDALAYLSEARKVGLSWVSALRERLDSAADDEKCRFRSRVAHTALVCVDTFNFHDTLSDGRDVLGLALQCAPDVTDFVSCCITIQECYSPMPEGLDPVLYWRWQQLCFRAYPILHRAILAKMGDALDAAVQRSWVAFNPAGSGWAASPVAGWLTRGSASASGGGAENLTVHYCLVTGELRVNGLPLHRLPPEYETHPMYGSLFGSSVLEVMPGDVPGMAFSGKKRYAGHEVHFGLSLRSTEQQDLLVRAAKDGQTWEFVDPGLFDGFPRRLVTAYVHWYNLDSNTVEFRPREAPWTTSEENWRLGIGKDGRWRLTKGDNRVLVVPKLLNAQSETAARMDAIFRPLVEEADLELVYLPSSSLLEIELPGLKLAFHLEKGSGTVQSRQFRGMSIDPDQDIGTLIGFDNKLVLKSNSADKSRKVILLEGDIEHSLHDSHARVQVSRQSAVLSHAYDVDTRLGRLKDNGSLESKLLVAYLHALTSFCLPDPMTKRTGSEQALDILNSAAVKSYGLFSPQHTKILEKIAALTPKRVYYPGHVKVMQSVNWDSRIGFLAQHDGFFTTVKSLFDAAAERAFLYKDRYVEPPKFADTEAALVRRNEIRTAAFRVSQYGAEKHTTEDDGEYLSRDMGQDSAKALDAFSLADYIVCRRDQLPKPIPANMRQHLWNYLTQAAPYRVLGAGYALGSGGSEDVPEYDAHWLLDKHNDILRRNLVLYHEFLSGRRPGMDRFEVAVWLATLAFANKADMPVIQLLAACVNSPAMASIQPPHDIDTFTPCDGYVFVKSTLLRDLDRETVYRPFHESPQYRDSMAKGYRKDRRAYGLYSTHRIGALDPLVECAGREWPTEKPSLANHPRRGEWETYVKTSEAVATIWKWTVLWYRNRQLEDYLGRLVDHFPACGSVSVDALLAVRTSASETLPGTGPRPGFVSKKMLFLCPPPDLSALVAADSRLAFPDHEHAQTDPGQADLLDYLVCRLDSMAQVAFERDYVAKLRESISSLSTRQRRNVRIPHNAIDIVEAYLKDCRERTSQIYTALYGALNGHMSSLFAVNLPNLEQSMLESCFSSHWPRLSPSFLLQGLSREKGRDLPLGWKECIVEYGVALVKQQRAERMMIAARNNDMAALSSELLNPGHENWNPLEYPDSLLLEVESGITIRHVQEEIAGCMRSPAGGRNAVMQLNMGEGKSSVIVPIVASALADGKHLVRVFVAKPQSKQMLEMLISKLGGLLDRVVFQMPTSRDLQATKAEAKSMWRMLKKCREGGGVLLLQPEHALSLQQMGTEFATSADKKDAADVLNLNRHWLHRTARDIVDESDENFSVKFELVYTMGLQQPVDHGPQRWRTIQEVLGLVRDIAPNVRRELPEAVEIHDTSSPGSFPRTRVLKPEAMQRVLKELVKRICDNGMAELPIPRQTPAVRDAVRTYITKANLSAEEINRVESPTGFWAESVRPTLVLIRGLVACDVLGFAFMEKRWRVNYGLAPDRRPPTRLAVPYRAKDQPSARSEYSQPDVVILLTCLTYYYSGLTDDDLFLAFDQLFDSDQAQIEYGRWVCGNTEIPARFRSLAGVNTEDKQQCTSDVFPHLRFSKAVIDYFLDRVVFPKEMKEFPWKLSSSGWDLGEQKVHPTTGFSGTNDSRRLLPLGMHQLDLSKQKHTNALVMSYLLRPETSVVDIPPRSPTQVSDADALLDLVVGLDPPVRVILDVGAQVLELDNLEVASQWLGRLADDHTRAAVFFDDNDELSVVDRNGYTERLQTSPFASQMDACLIFLDEAHTRGTDLKLPVDYRAAVTLGANQTKDGLMQGMLSDYLPRLTPLPCLLTPSLQGV